MRRLSSVSARTAGAPRASFSPTAAGHIKLAAEWLMVPMLVAGLTLPQAVFAYW